MSKKDDPETQRNVGARAAYLWREKLEFLLEQEAIETDAAKKFKLGKEIEEAKAKIWELRDNLDFKPDAGRPNDSTSSLIISDSTPTAGRDQFFAGRDYKTYGNKS